MGLLNTYPQIAGLHAPTHIPGGEDVVAGVVPAAHAISHILAGADPIIAGLDARAINLTAQGDVVYLSGVANTLARLAPGVAGQALLTGGAAANPSWGAPAPAAHVLDTSGPHTGTLLLTDLEVAVRGEIITRTVADWAVLATGTALQALLSGGAGADVYWGAPTPAAHVLNTTGPHTGTLQDSDVAGHAVGEVLAIISCSLDGGFTVTAGAAAVVNFTDFLLNISDFPADAKAIIRIVWANNGNNTNNMDLYDQFGAAPVGSSATAEGMATDVYEITETATPFTLPAGLKSFQMRLWVSAGTMTVAKVELQIERAA